MTKATFTLSARLQKPFSPLCPSTGDLRDHHNVRHEPSHRRWTPSGRTWYCTALLEDPLTIGKEISCFQRAPQAEAPPPKDITVTHNKVGRRPDRDTRLAPVGNQSYVSLSVQPGHFLFIHLYLPALPSQSAGRSHFLLCSPNHRRGASLQLGETNFTAEQRYRSFFVQKTCARILFTNCGRLPLDTRMDLYTHRTKHFSCFHQKLEPLVG